MKNSLSQHVLILFEWKSNILSLCGSPQSSAWLLLSGIPSPQGCLIWSKIWTHMLHVANRGGKIMTEISLFEKKICIKDKIQTSSFVSAPQIELTNKFESIYINCWNQDIPCQFENKTRNTERLYKFSTFCFSNQYLYVYMLWCPKFGSFLATLDKINIPILILGQFVINPYTRGKSLLE